MQQIDSSRIDALWQGFSRRERRAQNQLLSLFYDQLRAAARRALRRDSAACHLQPEALVREASVRIMSSESIAQHDLVRFLALSAGVTRQVLLDEVRKFRAAKRQVRSRVTMWLDPDTQSTPVEVEAVDSTLTQFASSCEPDARIAELRFFMGLTFEEIAVEMNHPIGAVKRQWQSVHTWLLNNLHSSAA